jgi:phosphate:Na+ symporter
VVIWVWFIDHLATFVRWVSPHHQELEGLSRLAAETPRQIANAHTLFNIANTLLFIGFTAPLAKVVEYLVPIREESGPQIKPRYLNSTLLETPEVALHHVRLELEGMGQAILPMLDSIPEALFQGSRQELTDIRKLDNTVDTLHSICITFLGQLSKQQLTNEQTEELHDLISIANYLENIGDTIETNMVDLGIERLEQDIRISEGTLQILTPLFASVYQTVDKAIAGLVERDTERAGDIIMAKGEIQHLADDAHSHLATRLTADAPKRVEAFRIETDTIENLRHIYYFAKRIAKCFADTNIRYETDNDE